MATFKTGNIYGSRSMTLNLTETNISNENNTSDVNWELIVSGDSTWYATGVIIQIDGNTVYSKEVNWDGGFPAQQGSISGTVRNINHNNQDGSKTISVVFRAYVYYLSYNDYGGNVELTKIPRASNIAVGNTDLGQNVAITIGKKVDAYTSTLTYKIGSRTGAIVSKTSQSNYVWPMPSELISQIKMDNPNNREVEAIVYCDTYSGDTKIGSTQEARFKLIIVDKPVITEVVREELIPNIANKTTAVLRSISKNLFYITATPPEGATITVYRVKNGNQVSFLSGINKVRLDDIQNYYEVNGVLKTKFAVVCADSRGNQSEEFLIEENFINYIHVSLNKTDIKITRTNATTNDAKVTLAGNFYNGLIGTTQNAITLKYKYRKQGTETWSDLTEIKATYDGNRFKTDDLKIAGDFDYQENWEFMFYASDILNDTDEYLYTFISSVPFVKWHKNGAWIKEVDTNQLRINGNQVIESGSNENGKYVKFSDGTMICRKKITKSLQCDTPFGSMFESAEFSFGYFPKEFVEVPEIFVKEIGRTGIVEGINKVSTTYCGDSWAMRPTKDAGFADYVFNYFAIGKWK